MTSPNSPTVFLGVADTRRPVAAWSEGEGEEEGEGEGEGEGEEKGRGRRRSYESQTLCAASGRDGRLYTCSGRDTDNHNYSHDSISHDYRDHTVPKKCNYIIDISTKL